MKKYLLTIAGCLAFAAAYAQLIPAEAAQRARELVARMTLEEKIDYLSGYTSFTLRPIERLGIPEIRLADGPQGIRNNTKSTLYPAGVLSAATWNRDLMRRLGQGLGQDAKARGVRILLGPGVNISRSPLCGRNFEYFGEDPYLTSEVAVNYIEGVQAEGVIATIKHFAANNQEWNRHHISSDVDERTLHEIYFPPFRRAVRDAKVGAVMNSYNLLNGVHTTENRWLNIDVLREMWGFEGILMSDWTSVYSAVGAANGGLDLEMPKGVWMNREKLIPAIRTGLVTEATIDIKVQHILQTLIAFGLFDEPQADTTLRLDSPASRQTALDLAREGMVLLRNEGNMLPLKGRTAVLGPNADQIPTGGGSGFVTPLTTVSVAQGVAQLLGKKALLLTDSVIFGNQLEEFRTGSEKGFRAEYFANKNLSGDPSAVLTEQSVEHNWRSGAPLEGFPADGFSVRWTATYVPSISGLLSLRVGGDDGYRLFVDDKRIMGDWGNHSYSSREVLLEVEAGREYNFRIEYFDNIGSAEVTFQAALLNEGVLAEKLRGIDNVVLCVGFDNNTEGEGFDRPFALPAWQQLLIDRVVKLHPNVAVVLNAGSGVDFSGWGERVRAILMAWYPGQEGGRAAAEILTGAISPSGKLPVTIDRSWDENPTRDSYYENLKAGTKRVEYREGVFVGYRGYDRLERSPRYPFGFGLSYTTFAYSDLTAERTAEGVRVRFRVTNTGPRDGAEAAQIYVRDVEASVPRPLKELKGFEKVSLRRGESKLIETTLDDSAFAYWDVARRRFVVEAGDFEILVGASSADLPLRTVFSRSDKVLDL